MDQTIIIISVVMGILILIIVCCLSAVIYRWKKGELVYIVSLDLVLTLCIELMAQLQLCCLVG